MNGGFALHDRSADSAEARTLAVLVGVVLVLSFFGLLQTTNGMHILFDAGPLRGCVGEAYFWLAHALLLFPACCLLGYGLSPFLYPVLRRGRHAIDGLNPRARVLGVAVLCLLALILSRLGHARVLLDYPITDDEYAARFGGQVLAAGHLLARLPDPPSAMPSRFFYIIHGNLATSMDWLGVQLAWAVAERSGLGPLVFAASSAVALGSVTVLAARRLGPTLGLFAGAIFVFSPMAWSLSITTHAHVLSRGLLALGLCLYSMPMPATAGRPRLFLAGLAGLALGGAFICRPYEIAFLCAPILLMGLHSYLLTGNPLLPPRMSPDSLVDSRDPVTLWQRFGSNLSYNLFMLTIWFLGPLGILLVGAGVLTDRFTRLLALGVWFVLGLALLHEVNGLHIVGPIHYSECAVPLTLLAIHGLDNLLAAARRLAPEFTSILKTWKDSGTPYPGTYVFTWRRPRPDLSDAILIFHARHDGRDPAKTAARLRAQLPGRRFFRLFPVPVRPFLTLQPIDP